MRSIFKFLLFLPTIIILNGCATLFNSDDYTNFDSDPSRSKVYIDGVYMGTTPLNLVLPTDRDYTVQFKKSGYESKTYMLNSGVGTGWIILDLFAGGLLPIVIDAATGAWYELDNDYVYVVMDKNARDDEDKEERDEAPAGKVQPKK